MRVTASPRPITPSHAQRFAALKREILDLEYFCKGTVLQRMMKCGNPRCPCHRHPGQRHGPYCVLYGLTARAVAARIDRDDVLFEIEGADMALAVVHLTWRKGSKPLRTNSPDGQEAFHH